MEKIDIKNRVKGIKSLEDFTKLLNDIKNDEFGHTNYPISVPQLLHFSNSKIPNRYKTFHIRKKSGGLREINAPCYQLSVLLHVLNILFKSIYTPNPCAMGFAEGRSIVGNASMHVGHHYVFNIDLEDFFPSIPQARIWKRLQLPPFNFTQEIANVLAGLCCHADTGNTGNYLPQGASTSPLLTNAICDTLDRRMSGVARRFGLHYSRYADDMSFSSMHNVYQEDSKFRKEIKRIIEEQGFRMNEKKTRLLRDGQRQEVTGLVVNSVVNVSRKYIRDLRCLLHVWETKGYAIAYSYFYPLYKKEKGYIKKGEPVMENVIGGKLNYLKMVKGPSNATYLKLLNRFNKLQGVVFVDNETDKGSSYIYVCSYSMQEFETLFHTSISLETSEKSNLVAKCQIAGIEKVLSVSKSTQTYLCPEYQALGPYQNVDSNLLSECFVTLCRAKGKNFWLITKAEMKRSRCLSLINANIDVNLLLDIWEKDGIEKAAHELQKLVNLKENLLSKNVIEDDHQQIIAVDENAKSSIPEAEPLEGTNLVSESTQSHKDDFPEGIDIPGLDDFTNLTKMDPGEVVNLRSFSPDT